MSYLKNHLKKLPRKDGCSRCCKPDGTHLGFGRYDTQSCRASRLSYRAIKTARRAIIGQSSRAINNRSNYRNLPIHQGRNLLRTK